MGHGCCPIPKPGLSCLTQSLYPQHFREQPQAILSWLVVWLVFSSKDKLLFFTFFGFSSMLRGEWKFLPNSRWLEGVHFITSPLAHP